MTLPVIGKSGLVLSALLLFHSGCSKPPPAPVINETLRSLSAQPTPESLACAKCHQDIFDKWVGSQHANANRLVSDAQDRSAFESPTSIHHGSFVTSMKRGKSEHFDFTTSFSNQSPEIYCAEAVIGISPLRQYLVPFPGGRLQVMDISYDPRSNEWFNVFGDENRQPHEWGHWKGRSMTWNVQCAFCHMTGYEKKYDIKEDRYSSTWKAMGISCSQCHAPMAQVSVATNKCPMVESSHPETSPSMDNCASCHARREELFGTFKPGDSFHDHFRLALPDQPGIYHADGQVLNEDFEYGSFMMSRMGHKGVTCMNCHDPHSGTLKAPVENNALCMQCHTPPGLNGAIPIDPVAHSFHKTDTPGSRCVDCHMPHNTYMQRDNRRDHGFTSPDPRLTIEYGILNACNRCHTDQTPQWADEWTVKWYGDKMNRRARDRARAVARFYEGDASVSTQLLAMAANEEIAAWRAALDGMLQDWSHESSVRTFLQGELSHSNALVRSTAIKSLREIPDSMVSDTSALVRVDAAMVMLQRNQKIDPAKYKELKAYIDNISDQPAGALRQANLALIENRPADAEAWSRKAKAWDPSAVPYYSLGRVLHSESKLIEAISNMTTAAYMDLENADYSYAVALAIAEVGNDILAMQWLEESVRRDPHFGRAWYNLGLAYSQADRLRDAIKALQIAQNNLPGSADPAYAQATIYLKQKEKGMAVSALNAALKQDPDHQASRALLDQLK